MTKAAIEVHPNSSQTVSVRCRTSHPIRIVWYLQTFVRVEPSLKPIDYPVDLDVHGPVNNRPSCFNVL